MNNKGYYNSSKWINTKGAPIRSEEVTVICKNCNSTWKEEMPSKALIAGYTRQYDFCSLCEQNYTKNHGRMSPLNLKAYGIGLDPKDNPKLGDLKPNLIGRFIDKPNNRLIDPNSLCADSQNGEII